MGRAVWSPGAGPPEGRGNHVDVGPLGTKGWFCKADVPRTRLHEAGDHVCFCCNSLPAELA